jgi:hypothetical protein
MTRKKDQDKSDVSSKLEQASPISIPHDLTLEGYQEALRNVRGSDPAAARRLERAIEPVLRKKGIFPRRRMPWYETSQGTRLRLALLSQNPHVEKDIEEARRYLGIPNNQVHSIKGDLLWREASKMVKPEAVRSVVEGNLAGDWLFLHRETAMGKTPKDDELTGLLSQPLNNSAVRSARVDLTSPQLPVWLRHPPNGPSPYQMPMSPIDWVTGRMIERHRLPWRIGSALTFYMLTQDPTWVEHLELLEVEVRYEESGVKDPGAFTMVVKGMDEYITESDWNHIWETYIPSRQNNLLRQRGMQPQGRRGFDKQRLIDMMDTYREMVKESHSFKHILDITAAKVDADNMPDEGSFRRTIVDLKDLLAPLP